MYLRVKYAETENGICVLRCYGYEQTLVIPDELMGHPVTELAPYACSSSDPGDRWKKYEIQETVLHEEEKLPGEEQELTGELLTEVYLPKHLKRIGTYAFYFCRQLKILHAQGELEDIEGGAFMWCKGLNRLTFRNIPWENKVVYNVLSEFTQELEASLFFADGTTLTLTFPEYYEESVENTPARIIDTYWHGSGYKYRQCFPERKLDLGGYDRLFPYAVANELPDTCLQLALNRLKYPLSLTEEAAGQYRKFLADHGKELVKRAVQKEDPDLLALMEEQGLLSEELTAFATSYAAERGAAEVGSFLMDYRRRHSGRRKKTFEL